MVFMDPTTDIAFKKLFANKEKPEILISFLNSILELPEGKKIVTITLNDPNNLPTLASEKHSIVDVSCTDQDNKHYIVEMQVMNQKNYAQRSQYYTAYGLVRQLKRGSDYESLHHVIFVGILDFVFSKNTSHLSHHYILEKTTHEHLLQHIEFHFVELPKFNKQLDALTSEADTWIYLLKYAVHLDAIPKNLSVIHEIDEALDILKRGNWSEAELNAEEKYWDSIRVAHGIKQAAFEQGIAEGLAEGLAEGKAEGKTELIQAMLNRGMSPDEIAAITGLSAEDITKIKAHS